METESRLSFSELKKEQKVLVDKLNKIIPKNKTEKRIAERRKLYSEIQRIESEILKLKK